MMNSPNQHLPDVIQWPIGASGNQLTFESELVLSVLTELVHKTCRQRVHGRVRKRLSEIQHPAVSAAPKSPPIERLREVHQ